MLRLSGPGPHRIKLGEREVFIFVQSLNLKLADGVAKIQQKLYHSSYIWKNLKGLETSPKISGIGQRRCILHRY